MTEWNFKNKKIKRDKDTDLGATQRFRKLLSRGKIHE